MVIAKEILASPVSTVAVEQTFSSGGNILDIRRSTLYPSSLEAQACVDDWSRAELRRQQQNEPNDFENLLTIMIPAAVPKRDPHPQKMKSKNSKV